MSSASATSSLAAIAARIQDRNNALSSELATLDELQSQHEHAKGCLEDNRQTSTEVRKKLLTAARSRHGLELECLRAKEESALIEKSTAEIKSKIEEIQDQTKELRRKFDEEQAPIYAAHDLSTKLFTMQSEGLLVRAQKRKQQREDKLHNLQEQTKRQRDEASKMRAERERIREECLEMSRREEEEDEESVAINLQIKSIIAKKATIRAALNDAKDTYQNATNYRDSWERKCVGENERRKEEP